MPLAPNPLLQVTPVTKTQPAAANPAPKAAASGKDNTPSFANVYSRQAAPKAAAAPEPRAKPVKAKPDAVATKQPVEHKPAAAKPAVADSGKSLPADKVSKKSDDDADDKDKVATSDTDADKDKDATDPLAVAVTPVDPPLDPNALQAAVPLTPEPPVAATPTPPPPPVEMPAVMAAVVVPQPPVAPAPVTDTKSFDPASDDPLAGLVAVQVALGQTGKSTTPATTTTTSDSGKTTATQTDSDPLQPMVNNLAVPTGQQAADNPSTSSGDNAFKGMIEAGLKDTKVAASDTRIDDFANRLAAMSDSAPKTAVTPVAVSPLSQPLAMHQGGWSEGIVDRVMYLSSQNLKSADIQLEPAELGRLDIRVNMAPDQQTQVTFMSAHPGVREALEGQMNKLRDSFTQQGLGQVDVSVADQSRGWSGQGQQNQQQANEGSRTGSASGNGINGVDGIEGEGVHEVAQVSQPMKVVGSSQIDYYA